MKKLLSSMFAVLFLTGISFAQPPEPPMDMEGMPEPPKMAKQDFKKMKKSFDEIAKEINLTDEQKQQIDTMAKADKEKKKELRKQIKEKFDAIDAELLKENYDINVINNLTSEIQNIQGTMAKMNVDGKIQMRSILTYDQFKQIEQMRQKNKNKFMNKFAEKKEEMKVAVSSDTAKVKADVEKKIKEDLKSAKEAEKAAEKAAKKKEKQEKKEAKKALKSKKK